MISRELYGAVAFRLNADPLDYVSLEADEIYEVLLAALSDECPGCEFDEDDLHDFAEEIYAAATAE